MSNSIINTGLKGMQSGLESAAKHAEQVTRAFRPDSEEDQVEGLVGLKTDRVQVQASAKVVKTGDELNQAILDILA